MKRPLTTVTYESSTILLPVMYVISITRPSTFPIFIVKRNVVEISSNFIFSKSAL